MYRLSLETQREPEDARWKMDSYAGLHNEGWFSAFIGAIGIHLLLAMLFVFVPGLLQRHRPMPPVYTVRLFETANVPSPRPTKTERHAPKVKTRPATKKPREIKRVKRAAQMPSSSVKTGHKKAISLHPKKPRHKKTQVVRKKTIDAEELLKRRLRKIEQEVKKRREEAFIKERLRAIRSKVKAKTKGTSIGPTEKWTGSESQSEALRLYCTKIWADVRRHWVLPEQLLDKRDLMSVVVVQIAQDGKILKAWHEQKSGYALFDRSALNAVKEAGPFPPLPRVLRPGPVEIGIRFRPGKVGD
jgi:protein TonB